MQPHGSRTKHGLLGRNGHFGYRGLVSGEEVPGGGVHQSAADERRRARASRRGWRASWVTHVVVCLLGGLVAALPAATLYALTATRVHDDVGIVPATLRLTHGHSALQTGLLGGTIYDSDLTRFGLGMTVTLDGPPGDLGKIHSLASPELKKAEKVYTSMFDHPASIKAGYTDALVKAVTRTFVRAEIATGLSLGAAALLIAGLAGAGAERRTALVSLGALLLLSVGYSVHRYVEWKGANAAPTPTFPIGMLAGTRLSDARADNQTTATLIDNIVPLAQRELQREQEENTQFVKQAYESVDDLVASGDVAVPAPDETACLLLSDVHANADMIAVYRHLVERLDTTYGPGTVGVTFFDGDQTYGSASAKTAVDAMAKISTEEYAVVGNHDSQLTIEQMQDAGMHLLDGPVQKTGNGLTAVGATDPHLTKQGQLFSASTITRPGYDGETEADAGRKLLDAMQQAHPTLGLAHEPYAFAPILDLNVSQHTMTAWFTAAKHTADTDSGATVDDGVPDIPASAVAYGHWHRRFYYRVAGNSDGTWTVVMELGTAGGASPKLSLSYFSTPQTIPGKEASAAIVIVDKKSGLVTGLQEITTHRSGEVTVGPRHPIGSPDGQPYRTDGAITP
jgi:hypothetical protein